MQIVSTHRSPIPQDMAKFPQRVTHSKRLSSFPVKKPLTQDRIQFGKLANVTGPIPPNSLIILVPGMYSPAYSMQGLANYFKARGHQTHILESPYNIKGGSTLESTDWLTQGIDRIRLEEASTRYINRLDQLENIPQAERIDFLCNLLGLEKTEAGKATAKAALGLMFTPESNYHDESEFTRLTIRLRKIRQDMGGTLPAETARKQIYSLSAIARNQLRRELRPIFSSMPGSLSEQQNALDKTLYHVMDQIAPRVVLVGHSMGGFVSMLTLFEQMNDIAMVVGLSAPGENGTEPIPPGLGIFHSLPLRLQQEGRSLVEKFAPALAHMVQGSIETDKLKANHQPFNTTLFAVGLPDNFDGLVGEKNFKLNDQLPGRINVVVTPRQANITDMVSGNLSQLNRLLRLNPLYAWTEDKIHNTSQVIKSIAYHCGILQHHEKYWKQDGDILRGVLEAPKNAIGQYDYQQGIPDNLEALKQIRRIIAPFNYEAERLHFLNLIEDQLIDAQSDSKIRQKQLQEKYMPLKPDLEIISHEKQPLQYSAAQKAKQLLNLLEMQPLATHLD